MKHITIETPNMDGFLEPSELSEVKDEINELMIGLSKLRVYAEAKMDAMHWRLRGDIKRATTLEQRCEFIFNTLPPELRW